jgi:hypothetical protein
LGDSICSFLFTASSTMYIRPQLHSFKKIVIKKLVRSWKTRKGYRSLGCSFKHCDQSHCCELIGKTGGLDRKPMVVWSLEISRWIHVDDTWLLWSLFRNIQYRFDHSLHGSRVNFYPETRSELALENLYYPR